MWLAGSFGIFGVVLVRRRRGSALMLIVACALVSGLAGCGGGGGSNGGGGGNAPPTPQPGTPAGNYTVTVTATGGTLVKTANFSLTVQ
jgi:hypothetical protein